MKIPLLDLKAQYEPIKDEITAALQEVIDNTSFAGGPLVERFEKLFSPFCQTEFTIGADSGTAALWMALLGLGIGVGDEVITTPNTFIATAEAISFCGATPVSVDVDQTTFNIDPALIEKAITPRTKAIVPVHLYGQMADMDPIMEIARSHKLAVVEDACQAHGAEYNGRRAGSIGDAGCFSFYPGKNLGAYGEAGAVTTNNKELAVGMQKFRDHGQDKKYYHSVIGWNARMDGFQGAVLSVKMKYLEGWTESRRRNAKLYSELLGHVDGARVPREADYARHVYHVYAIQLADRDAVLAVMAEKGVNCGIHYPIPVHLQKAYGFLGYKKGDFPIAESAAASVLSLPMYPELTEEQIRYVVDVLMDSLTGLA